MSFLECVYVLLSGAWEVITNVKYPGTEMSIAVILVGSLCAVFSLRVVGYLIGVRYDLSAGRRVVEKAHGVYDKRVRHSEKVGN